MIHAPIQIKNLTLSFPHKTCFEDFSCTINPGDRIAIIGRNGNGKSSLLKLLQEQIQNINFGFVPQIIEEFAASSGGERFNKALNKALLNSPSLLILDEPTNHLDASNRDLLMRMLEAYNGTLIIVSHDVELLRHMNIIWHIDQEKIVIFKGNYDDYMREKNQKRAKLQEQLSILEKDKKEIHYSLMKEQQRAKNSRKQGEKHIEQRKWPTVVSYAKARRAEETSGKKKADIKDKRLEIREELANIYVPEIIKPKFHLNSRSLNNVVLVKDASIAYDKVILEDINFSLYSNEHVAILGDNGSGKTSFLKAILDDANIKRYGTWEVPKFIGYLDQHYSTLNPGDTVFDTIQKLVPDWKQTEIRKFLNDFLFRKNEEISTKVSNLSGGEKVRLSLAIIAAKTPSLLILDEITNNLDLETKEHVIQVLKEYRGGMIIISHDKEFLKSIKIDRYYRIVKNKLV